MEYQISKKSNTLKSVQRQYCMFQYIDQNNEPDPDPLGSKNITIPYPGAIFGSFLKL